MWSDDDVWVDVACLHTSRTVISSNCIKTHCHCLCLQAGLKFIVTLWGDDAAAAAAEQAGQLPCPVLSFDQLLAAGRAARGASSFAPVPLGANDVATLVYTSGTTGQST